MDDHLLDRVLSGLGRITHTESLQQLWGGYGDLVRVYFDDSARSSVIVKNIAFPQPEADHPRGWSGSFAHQRKLKSYQVEARWYQTYAGLCDELCYCPRLIHHEQDAEQLLLVMEDLGEHFPVVTDRIGLAEVRTCLNWLARFHARFMFAKPEGLWPEGTYWHLATRPDELTNMAEGTLKDAAGELDKLLKASAFQTLVHGDAKLANFCFSLDGRRTAAVDFQYVGAGCGMKDVVYFFSSCLDAAQCELHCAALLDSYFSCLTDALAERMSSARCAQLEAEWRRLYPVAWADFQRFLDGWSPQHWKRNTYMLQQTDNALQLL